MKKILLVSHSESFLGRNKTLLNRAGFVILTATSANEALQAYREHPVDLVISMLDMPDLGGDKLCSSIRAGNEGSNVPILLVCYSTEGALKRISQCGATGWLTKPVHPEQLLEKVAEHLKIPIRRDHRARYVTEVKGQWESVPFSGRTRNISVSGILCETDFEFNGDDLLTDLLLAIDSHSIVTDGKVVRSETCTGGMFNYGVQFTNLPDQSREKIEELIKSPGEQGESCREPAPLLPAASS